MSSYSKYNQISTKRPPHKKRTKKVQGSGEDDGRYYKCWYCGFTNRIDRAALGVGEGNTYSIGILDNQINPDNPIPHSVSTTGNFVLIQTKGLVFDERHNVGSQASSGCAFCGSLHWR